MKATLILCAATIWRVVIIAYYVVTVPVLVAITIIWIVAYIVMGIPSSLERSWTTTR